MAEVARIVRVTVVIVFTTTVESDLDYIRLDIDAEQLVEVCLVTTIASSTLSSHQQTEDLPRQHCLNGLSNRIV